MRAAFSVTVERAKEALVARRFRAAAALLSRAPALSNVERRIRAHLLGLVRFRMGETGAAFRLWEEAERRYGPNVLMAADVLEALREHGAFDQLAERIAALQAEYENAIEKLSALSKARCCRALEKPLEAVKAGG